MVDIKRNGNTKKDAPKEVTEEGNQPEQITRTTVKPVEYTEIKEKGNKGVQVTLDNYLSIQMRLFNSMNTNLVTIIKLLKEIKDKK